MKKTFVALLAAIFVTGISGCLPGTKVAEIEKAMLAAKVGEEMVKVNDAADGFAGETEKIVFAGVLKNGQNSLTVKWHKQNPDKIIKTETKKSDAAGEFNFEIFKPTVGWDSGDYVMEVLSGDTKITEKEFSIKAEDKKTKLYNKQDEKNNPDKKTKGAKSDTTGSIETEKVKNNDKTKFVTPKSNPAMIAESQKPITTPEKAKQSYFVNGFMCEGLNDDGSCKGKTDFYYDNATKFYANTEWKNLKKGDYMWGVWYWEGLNGKGEYISDASVDVPNDQSGFINFSLTNTDGKYWYSGSYWVEVYYNGAYFTTIPFGVYKTTFKPTYKYPQTGYYDSLGNYILYDGSGYYDVYGTFWNFGTDWGLDDYSYPEPGYYDEFGNYILDDGSGYYDQYGYFWFWDDIYGDGWYDEAGNYYLADGSGYYDIYGNYWPLNTYTPPDASTGYYDADGNYILNDGSGYYDIYGNFWSWSDFIYDDYYYDNDGYYDSYGNYVLYDGSGYYDPSGNFMGWDTYTYDDYYGDADGYYDAYGNYVLYDGSGYYDPSGNFWGWDDYYYDDYSYDYPNGDVGYWDDSGYYDDTYYDDSWYY